jgi:hypothetical protein
VRARKGDVLGRRRRFRHFQSWSSGSTLLANVSMLWRAASKGRPE